MISGDPIIGGMLVWDGDPFKRVTAEPMVVRSVVSRFTPQAEYEGVYVLVAPFDPSSCPVAPFEVEMVEFCKRFYRRMTMWERIESARFDDETPYYGPLRGHHVIKASWQEFIKWIPDRPNMPAELSRAEYDEAVVRAGGSYTATYEKYEPTGWKLVLEPAL